MVEGYGVKVDQEIHAEVLARNKQFTSAPYSGFVNPVITPKTDAVGAIIGFDVVQPESFEAQMLEYAKHYSNLPVKN